MGKKTNKGFSMVELIIVIAIMAILVGVMAPQLMKYIEKSRYSKDIQVTKLAYTALKTANANEEAYEVAPTPGVPIEFDYLLDTSDAFHSEVLDVFGASSYTFTSKAFEGQKINVTPNNSGGFEVQLISNIPSEYDSITLIN